LDGHGLHGQTISNIFGQEIRNRLCSHPLFAEDIEQAIYDVLMSIEFDIYKQEARLADYSGTTVALAVIRDRQVTVANVGDSRVVLGKRRRILHRHSHPQSHQQHHNNEHSLKHPSSSTSSSSHPTLIDALPLSVDHKPHLPSEHARILAAGGRVFSVRYEDGMIGPPRVWLGGFDLPGLAMSRSLGDFVVHTAGVISRPDIIHYELHNDEDCYLVVGTDGLWDVLNNQEVLSLVHQCKSPHEGILRLFQEARARWWLKDNGIDDTTVCVMHFHVSPQTRSRNNSAVSVNTAATSTDMSVCVESHECFDDRNTDHNLADNIASEKSSNDIQLFDNIKLLSTTNLPISDSK
jgi:serine/threonine protein phosphatase PrpC